MFCAPTVQNMPMPRERLPEPREIDLLASSYLKIVILIYVD